MFGKGGEDEFNAFIWYWLWLKVPNRMPKENEAYYEFKRYFADDYDGDTEGLLKELRGYAHRYASLFLGKEKDDGLRRVFGRIVSLDVKQIRPLLMLLYSVYEEWTRPQCVFTYLRDYRVVSVQASGLRQTYHGPK